MALESPLFQNLDAIADLVPVDRIVLFEHASGAETFAEKILPVFNRAIVVSTDTIWPKNDLLAKRAREALRESESVKLVVFGQSALKKLTVRTQRLLIMDDIIMQDFKRHGADRAQGLDLSPPRLAFMIQSFFEQWDKLPRIAHPAFGYAHFCEFKADNFDWRTQLLGIRR